MLSAIDSGRELSEFTAFLTQRAGQELPNVLSTLIGDVQSRAGQLTDRGHVRIIECADPTTAVLIANDRTLRALCFRVGETHLDVPLDNEMKFRKALLKLGYVGPQWPTA